MGRRQFTPEFKTRIVLELLREEKPLGWELSDTLDSAPVLAAVKDAIRQYGKPEIINSDQGSQFSSDDYTSYLKVEGVRQSMDGKARWVDNVVIERWFRSLKTERIYNKRIHDTKST
jgi:putative transposase